jgi:hypothetical protein
MMSPHDRRRCLARSLAGDPARLSPVRLQAIADGEIMDPNRIYLPAGRLSLAETEARERAGMERLGPL